MGEWGAAQTQSPSERAKFFRFCSEHQKIDTGLKFLVAESVFEIKRLKSKKYRFLDQSLEKHI